MCGSSAFITGRRDSFKAVIEWYFEMLQRVGLSVVLVPLILVLSACGGGGGSSSESVAADPAPVTPIPDPVLQSFALLSK